LIGLDVERRRSWGGEVEEKKGTLECFEGVHHKKKKKTQGFFFSSEPNELSRFLFWWPPLFLPLYISASTLCPNHGRLYNCSSFQLLFSCVNDGELGKTVFHQI
jgi:hypothetical protein